MLLVRLIVAEFRSARPVRSAIVISRLGGTLKDTTSRGDIAEFQVVAARYDLLIDNADGTFTRVQCKSDVFARAACYFACTA
jgi:hypothetical protein